MKLVRFGALGHEKPGLRRCRTATSATCPGLSPTSRGDALGAESLDASARPSIPHRCRWLPAGQRLGACVGQVRKLHRHRPELCRSRRRDRRCHPGRADRLQQGAVLHRRAQRRRDHSARFAEDRLGGRARHRHRRARLLCGRERSPATSSPAIASATTSRSANTSSSAAAPGPRARAARPSARSDPGSSRRDEIPDPQNLSHVARREWRAAAARLDARP